MWKKILKIFGALFAFLVLTCAISWQINKERWQEEYSAYCKTAAPILLYHAVGPATVIEWPRSLIMPTAVFEKHMQYLTDNGYKIISVKQLAERLAKQETVEKHLALSFDDGYKNNFSEVLPVLQKYSAKASFFIVNNEIGKEIYMDEAELKVMLASGMELGSHTVNHAPLAMIEEKYLPWEISGVRRLFKKRFAGYEVRTIAYPNGSYNAKVLELAEKYGFTNGLTGKIGANTSATYKNAPLEMYRIPVADDASDPQYLEKRLERAYLWGFLQSKGLDLNLIRDIFL